MKIKAYIKLMRPKHYLKNFLIFLPLIFGGVLFESQYLVKGIYAFIAFSLIASAVYVLNDIKDKSYDEKHPKKRYRPLAAGVITVPAALVFTLALLGGAAIFQSLIGWQSISAGLLLLYLLINIGYSFGLKNLPIIDVAIISLGFVLRVVYGGYAVGTGVSKWLYLAILVFSFYLALGKRRNEIKTIGHDTRKVNRHYNQDFLDKNMYVCFGLTIVYYSLWAIDPSQQHKKMYLTIPVVLIIAMLYSLTVESMGSEGDPINVVLDNKVLLSLVFFYGLLVIGLIYA